MSTILSFLDRTRLGAPIERETLTLVPLLQNTNGGFSRDYIPLGDALRQGAAKVTEVSDAGSVPRLTIQNKADVAVFILDGEELVGARQNRIVNLSILVPAKSTLPIPVSCVERGRWSYRTREFHTSPNVIFAAGRASKMSQVTQCLTMTGMADADQHAVWEQVAGRSRALGASSPTEAMLDSYEARRKALDELLASLTPAPDQVGAVFAVAGRVVGVELFETPEVFAAYFPKVVRSYALEALLERGRRDFVATEAELLLGDLRQARTQRFRGVGLGDDVRIEDRDLTGGALLLDERVVHLAAFRRAATQ